jgi:hypothetical protein
MSTWVHVGDPHAARDDQNGSPDRLRSMRPITVTARAADGRSAAGTDTHLVEPGRERGIPGSQRGPNKHRRHG